MTRLSIILAAGVSALAFSSAAKAADLIISEPVPYVGVVEASGGNWEGAFIGVFGGYGWGTATDVDGVGIFATDTLDLQGWLVGADIGYNFYLSDGIVAGVVADIAWSDIGGVYDGNPTTVDFDWQGSLRGRLGIDGGAFMPYLTGGLAVAGVTIDDDGAAASATHIGWTVGAGVEIAVTEDLSLDLQYRYSDYGAKDYALWTDPTPVSLTTHQVTAGLHWNF